MRGKELVCPACGNDTFHARKRESGIVLDCVKCEAPAATTREEYETHA